MAYAKIRVREISSGEIGATDIHNTRLYDEHPEIKVPKNLLDDNGERRDSSNNTRTLPKTKRDTENQIQK
jgi:hypothetical protein